MQLYAKRKENILDYSGFNIPWPVPFKKKKRSVNKFLPSDSGKFQNNVVYCPISKDLKDCALWLISHGYAPEDICKLFDISRRSIIRWKQNDCFHGSVIPPPNPIQCRPCILNNDMTHDLCTLLEEALEMYLSEIWDWIALTYQVHINRAALHLNICDAGITYKLLHKAVAECNEDLCQEWMQDVDTSAPWQYMGNQPERHGDSPGQSRGLVEIKETGCQRP